MRSEPKRGQALIEFAIIGSLALLALAFLIQIGLRVNYQQEMDQQTFRRAMKIAQSEGSIESASINYNQFRDRQLPDPSDGFSMMPRTLTEGTANVIWGEHLAVGDEDDRNSQTRIMFQVNDALREFRDEDFSPRRGGGSPSLPHVTQVTRQQNSSGSVQQSDAKTSSLSTTTTQTTALTLKSSDTVAGAVTSSVDWNW